MNKSINYLIRHVLGCKQGIDQQIFNGKSISHKITQPQS